MKSWMAVTAAGLLNAGLMLGVSTAAWADCIQGREGTIYSCGGSPQWNFETGKWTCVSANGQTVSGEKVDCPKGGGGRDAGADDDLLEPLVPGRGRHAGPIMPGDPRHKIQQPK